ncbi:DNA invertase Pin-like site-specific DNA recombinase [Planomicrobium sp. HSC-17F08]|nr:DNA invertase Pin-like site-specific DNA recombinase [Planomicrobium sp. HSC-17F08]
MIEPKKYGYARVPSAGQNLDAQMKQLKEAGCDIVFHEKVSGRSKDNREQFNILLEKVIAGDTIIVTKLDRLPEAQRTLCTPLIS